MVRPSITAMTVMTEPAIPKRSVRASSGVPWNTRMSRNESSGTGTNVRISPDTSATPAASIGSSHNAPLRYSRTASVRVVVIRPPVQHQRTDGDGTRVLSALFTPAQDGEQAQHLDVEPHKRDRKPESGGPGELRRDALLDALLDEVEVEDQAERGQADGEQADQHTEDAGAETEHAVAGAEDLEQQVDQAEHQVTAEGDHDAALEPGRDPDPLAAVGPEGDREHRERGQDGLRHDAVEVVAVDLHALEDAADAADEQ